MEGSVCHVTVTQFRMNCVVLTLSLVWLLFGTAKGTHRPLFISFNFVIVELNQPQFLFVSLKGFRNKNGEVSNSICSTAYADRTAYVRV